MYRVAGFVVIAQLALFCGLSVTFAEDPAEGESPRKRALLVGISKYERQPEKKQPPDWWNLASANDIRALKDVLKKGFAFQELDILELCDEKATRKGIVDAFRLHLIKDAKPGDVVYFHFSGHGQRVADDNGDEFDGMDESLIPFDYKTQDARDGALTNVRDDTIAELLAELQEAMSVEGKVQGNITVTLDCCFSGTATRGDDAPGRLTQRGRSWKEELDGPLPLRPEGRGGREVGIETRTHGAVVQQGYVVITASSNEQLAGEWPDPDRGKMGALTSFLTREWEATPQATYRSTYEKADHNLRAVIRDQNPQIEGSLDTALFSGLGVPRDPYFVVESVNGNTFTLPAGEVHFIKVGSVFHLYKAGGSVKDPVDKIAEAVIAEVRGASCTAHLAGPFRGKVDEKALRAARALEVERAYGKEELLRVYIAEGARPEIVAEVKKVKVATTADATNENFDVRIRLDEQGNLILERAAAVFAILSPNTGDATVSLHSLLLNEWRTRLLLRLVNPVAESLTMVDVRAVPAVVDVDGKGAVRSAMRRADVKEEDGITRAEFRDGDYMMLELRHRPGSLPAHVTVLHFPPDGAVYCLYPEFDDQSKLNLSTDKWTPLGGRLAHLFVFKAECLFDKDKKPLSIPAVDSFKVIATRESNNYHRLLPTRRVAERSGNDVRREVADHPARGNADGNKSLSYDLARLLGTATLGEDPDPENKQRASLLPAVVTDWSTSTLKVETRAQSK